MNCQKLPVVAYRQRGAATLVVVMILFFIMAMMAAFANRNLIFEQRIASNYYRSGVALEVADAGADWALGMLNGINIDQSCVATGDIATSQTSFRQRYLTMAPATRILTPTNAGPSASCVRVAGQQGWTCKCPVSGWTDATVADAAQMQPSFALTLQPSGRSGILRLLSASCTGSKTTTCTADQSTANNLLLGAAVVRIEAALVSALKMPPAMPLTVKQTISTGSTGLGLHNADPRSNGLLLLSGGLIPNLSEDRLESLPGTPGQQGLIRDEALAGMDPAEMFQMFFGMSRSQYQNQPAMRVITCDGDCSATLANAYSQGVRMAWIEGPLTLSSNVQIGTAARPMVLVANGTATLNGPMRLYGLLYVRGNVSWSNSSADQALLSGALITEGSLHIDGPVDLWYQSSIIDMLSNGMGSFVRVPGSWWDVGGV